MIFSSKAKHLSKKLPLGHGTFFLVARHQVSMYQKSHLFIDLTFINFSDFIDYGVYIKIDLYIRIKI